MSKNRTSATFKTGVAGDEKSHVSSLALPPLPLACETRLMLQAALPLCFIRTARFRLEPSASTSQFTQSPGKALSVTKLLAFRRPKYVGRNRGTHCRVWCLERPSPFGSRTRPLPSGSRKTGWRPPGSFLGGISKDTLLEANSL